MSSLAEQYRKFIKERQRISDIRNPFDHLETSQQKFAHWVRNVLWGTSYQVANGLTGPQILRYPVTFQTTESLSASDVRIRILGKIAVHKYLEDIEKRYAKPPKGRKLQSLQKHSAHIFQPIALSWNVVPEGKNGNEYLFHIDVTIARTNTEHTVTEEQLISIAA